MFEPQAQTRGASSSSSGLPISRNSAGSFTTAPEGYPQGASAAAPATKLSESHSRYLAPTIPEQSAASQENLLEAVNDAAALHSKLSSSSPSMAKAALPDASSSSSPMVRSSSQASGLAPLQEPQAHKAAVGTINNSSSLSQSMSSPSVVLPSLPGEGLMSGPYPMIRPMSTLEPLQTATAMPGAPTVAPTSPDQLSPTGFPDSSAMAVPLQSSSSPFQQQQNRFSQTSLPSPNFNNNNNNNFTLAGTPAARLSSSPEPAGMLPSPSSYMNTQMRGPFPPVGGYYTPQMPNSNSRNDLAAAAVPMRKPEPEICIECMMRDREMADVDVTTPGVWSRSSDVDFYEALAAEDEEDRQLAAAVNNGDSSVEGVGTSKQHYHLGRSPQSPAAGSTSFFNAQGSEESGYAASASGASVDRARNSKLQHGSRKKRVGRGEALLAPSLKAWNGMVAPVSNYRWKSLQAYLSDQCQYLNPQALAEERERYHALRAQWAEASLNDLERGPAARPADSAARSPSRLRTRSTAFDLAEDQAQTGRRRSRVAEAAQSRNGRPRTSVDENNKPSSSSPMYQNPVLAASNSSMPPTLQSQPRRYSSPLLDLPTANAVPQPSSPNPARNDGLLASPKSFDAGISRSYFPTARAASPSAWSERPRSIWSNFGGRFRKGNGSSTSLAISGGSMLDMHLGLSVDRHVPQTPVSRYDAQQQFMHDQSAAEEEQMAYDQEMEGQSKRKKKGLKKFLSRIFDGNSAASSSTAAPNSNPARNSRGRSQTQGGSNPPLDLSYLSGDSNEPLEPPVPSYLAASGGPGVRHDRSASSSSQSSLPHSPKDVFPSPAFRRPTSYYFDQQPSSPADSSHVLAATQNMHEPGHHKGVHIPSAINEKSMPVPSSLPPAAGSTADLALSATARNSQDLRRQKSLPALPVGEGESPEDVVSELPVARPSSQPPNVVHQYPQSARPDLYSFDVSRSTHGFDDDSSSMRKSKSKSKLFSLPFRKHKEPKSSSDDRS